MARAEDTASLRLAARQTLDNDGVFVVQGWAPSARIVDLETLADSWKLGVLVDKRGKPVQGRWNFDAENRQAFKRAPEVPPPYRPWPDAVTREVMDLVGRTWPDAPGRMDGFTRGMGRRGP